MWDLGRGGHLSVGPQALESSFSLFVFLDIAVTSDLSVAPSVHVFSEARGVVWRFVVFLH